MFQDFSESPEIKIPEKLPLITLRGVVMFPSAIIPLMLEDENDVRIIEKALEGDRIVGFVSQKDERIKDPKKIKLYDYGVAALVLKKLVMPDNTYRVIIQGINRIKLLDILRENPYPIAKVEVVPDIVAENNHQKALEQKLLNQFQKLISLSENLPEELNIMALNLEDPAKLADLVAMNLSLRTREAQSLLETLNLSKRIKRILQHLNNQIKIAELSSKLQDQAMDEIRDSQREIFLRQQLKAIREELGEEDEEEVEYREYMRKIKKAKMPEQVEVEAVAELERLVSLPPMAAEYIVIRNYLDWLVALPWSKQTKENIDIERAQRILKADHYNLEQAKDRILEYLAVRKLKDDMKSPILCLVGPPGVGKTSLGKSIARATKRRFYRISLGGIRDEAEIRGHRRTYVGAMPGRIIQGIKRAGAKNPVFMLDEIDKLGIDFRGDPSSALLEVLDPEQNNQFSDHYIEHPFDLSQVMFITTANVLDTIPGALMDRMEVIRLPGYVDEEKYIIARKYLIPRQLKEHGIKADNLRFSKAAIMAIIENYTDEAGVRNLEREIAKICRKVAVEAAKGKQVKVSLTRALVEEYLGPPKFYMEKAEKVPEIGVAAGLAWTVAGGEIIFVEAIKMKGKKGLSLTGQMGDVMKESAQAALSYIRSQCDSLKLDAAFFEDLDIHIHIPEGAVPKDGPSAGVPLAVALYSVLGQKKVRCDVAMTGEITLRGKILPVGGLKEKLVAAKRAGMKVVLLPSKNKPEVSGIPKHIIKGLEIKYINNINQAFELSLINEN